MTKQVFLLGGPDDGTLMAVPSDVPIQFVHLDGMTHLQHTEEYQPTDIEIFRHVSDYRHDDTGEAVAFEEYPYSSSPRPCNRCGHLAYAGLAIRCADGSQESVCIRCLAKSETARRQLRSL
jgi:hypothetical protein